MGVVHVPKILQQKPNKDSITEERAKRNSELMELVDTVDKGGIGPLRKTNKKTFKYKKKKPRGILKPFKNKKDILSEMTMGVVVPPEIEKEIKEKIKREKKEEKIKKHIEGGNKK